MTNPLEDIQKMHYGVLREEAAKKQRIVESFQKNFQAKKNQINKKKEHHTKQSKKKKKKGKKYSMKRESNRTNESDA